MTPEEEQLLDRIRAFLWAWPNQGGDSEIAAAVENIVANAEARALAAEMALAALRDSFPPHSEVITKFGQHYINGEWIKAQLRPIDLTAAREVMEKAREADTLRTQLAEQTALMERLVKTLGGVKHTIREQNTLVGYATRKGTAPHTACAEKLERAAEWAEEAIALTPAAALDEMKAEIRREVAEEAAKKADMAGFAYLAAEIRAMQKGGGQ